MPVRNAEKVFFPEVGCTKEDLAAYCRAAAERMLPELRGRPLMLERHPDGVRGPRFMQKHNRSGPQAAGLRGLGSQVCRTPHRASCARSGQDEPVQVRPITPELLVRDLAARIAAAPRERRLRVAVDGPPATRPEQLADALVDPLRVLGRKVVRVAARDFLRPASLRHEFGRQDPDVLYDEWLDTGALLREVLTPLEPGGSARVLPSLWDSVRDRATRAAPTDVPPGGVLLLDGALLLGRGLPFELTVHLSLSSAALGRRTPPEDSWTLPAYDRYQREADPTGSADVVVRVEDPRHPALVERQE